MNKLNARTALTLFFIVGAVVLLILMFTTPIPEPNKDMAYLFVGGYIGWCGASITYWFGTSKGSSDKQDELNRLREGDGN